MMKVTVLYNHPDNADAFEAYYAETHTPIALKMPGVEKMELTRFVAAPGGGTPAYYRMAELYFSSQAQMEQTLGSPEGKATVADLKNFATGGYTVIIGSVDS